MSFNLAPRIKVYAATAPPPSVDDDWLVLPLLDRGASESFVFGDGSHATTQLCAGVLDLLCRQLRPEAVLDVGTGTGVLARIARARGARFVVGTDIDSSALVFADANCSLDANTDVTIELSTGAPDAWGARFDLIVANILEEPLRGLAPALRRALRTPSGVLLLSGFTRAQTPALRVHYENAGFTFVSEAHRGEWALLRFGV